MSQGSPGHNTVTGPCQEPPEDCTSRLKVGVTTDDLLAWPLYDQLKLPPFKRA